MKKLNLPLIIGSLILILILSVILFPEVYTDKSPYNIQRLIFSTSDGSLNIEKAPYPPSKDFIMGSDEFGRDILSFIIYGTGLTILLGILIAIGRFLIAVPMALSAGFGNISSKTIIRQFNILFSAIPALLICAIILKLEFFAGLEKAWSVAAFVIILSLVGWPKIGSLIMERADALNQQSFIRSEVAIGKSRFAIAVENVFPHLAPELLVLFFMEVARALSMIMQLGIFSVFIGLLKIIKDTEGAVSYYNVSFEPEWAGMLSTSRSMVSVAPWTVLFPALAFFVSVLGFNLFGEGLRNILQRRDSMFIPRFRKLLSFELKYIWSGYGKKAKTAFFTVVSVIIALTLVITLAGGNKYGFEQVHYNLPDYEQVIIGTYSAEETAAYIADEMDRLGILPLKNGEYTARYNTGKSSMVISESFVISSGGREVAIEFETDYNFVYAAEGEFYGKVYDATNEDMLSNDTYDRFNNKFVMIDKVYYNDSAVNYFINEISSNADVLGILVTGRTDEKTDDKFTGENEVPVITIARKFAKILAADDAEITLSVSLLPLNPEGINIIGMYEGAEGAQHDEAIVIGMGYNYLNAEEKEILEFNLQLMERICALEQNCRSIIFIFIDGTGSDALHGINGVTDNYPYSASKSKVYVDLTGLQTTVFDKIRFSSAQAPYTRQYAWSLAHQLEKAFNSKKMETEELETIFFGREYYFTESYVDNAMFFDRGIATIIMNTEERAQGQNDIYDLGEILLETIRNNNY